MYICPQCGKKNKDDAVYCDDCGATLHKDAVASLDDRFDGTIKIVDESEPMAAPIDYSRSIFGKSIPESRDGRSFRDPASSASSSKSSAGGKSGTLDLIVLILSFISLFMCFGCLSPLALILAIMAAFISKNNTGSISRLSLVALIMSICGCFMMMVLLFVATRV